MGIGEGYGEGEMFDVPFCQAGANAPIDFLLGCCPITGWFAACTTRKRALGDQWPEDYYCCQDTMPCTCFHDCSNANPECCVIVEGCLLPPAAHLANRHLLKEKYGVEDYGIEKPLIQCLVVFSFLGCLSASYLACCLGCINAQHVHEMNHHGDK